MFDYENWAHGPITESDFYDTTAAIFEQAERPSADPDYVSASGSTYWYTAEGVYRLSNHWGHGIKSCIWYLRGVAENQFQTVSFDGYDYKELCGFVRFCDMVRVARGDEYWGWFDENNNLIK